MLKTDGLEKICNFTLNFFVYLNLCKMIGLSDPISSNCLQYSEHTQLFSLFGLLF